ncbi:MAG TPA: aldehyde dehydrogenase family protein [Gaiellales bacterium]|nr:aldehyde dehydrogenase family protein [Gaiellales bacterium]
MQAIYDIFSRLGLDRAALADGDLEVRTPITGDLLARVSRNSEAETDAAVARAAGAFETWRDVPAPRRGELVRLLGEELRREKDALGALVTLETGKIAQEGLGEVQEMIDVCDLAVGLSRQLFGRTIASERPGHRMLETWHPLGPIAVITAFNFPVAVWSWNSALALVCGDPVVWKPSERTPLTALACQALFRRAAEAFGDAPEGLLEVVIGGADRARQLAEDTRLPLVSATGSTVMGKALSPLIAARLGRSLLELGGNNGMVVAPSADLDLAVRAVVFSAVGTAGQRCTSLRRLIVHESIADELVDRLERAYASVPVGDPRESGTLCGPLISEDAFRRQQAALERARRDGGNVSGGERVLDDEHPGAFYVRPAVVRMPEQTEIVAEETFAPILYALTYDNLDEAVALHNEVPQGLSSCIFTTDLREAEVFLAAAGSDCGIANVNIGPSGAEIGGAFGGEKDTGGGRESGSDAWKAYMRRQTATINGSSELPLAQGIVFDVG